MAGVYQAERRAERMIAREKRAKEQAKAKIRDEVRRLLIEKGAVVTAVSSELIDIHGCFERAKQYLGAIGGQLQQLYYAVNAIFKLYEKENIHLKQYTERMAEDPKQEALK